MITKIDWQEFDKFSADCREKHIPVVRKQTAELLCEMVQKNSPEKILELGTAVGYSGTLMLLSSPKSQLKTVDINSQMCDLAKQTFMHYNVEKRAEIICSDILSYLEQETQRFDFVFLDGPKGQYIKYLPHLKRIVKSGGIIFCDDVLYYGMVLDDSKVIHKKITIVRNLRDFISKCKSDVDFETELLEIDDGVLILKKK